MPLDLFVDELAEILHGGHGVEESVYRQTRRAAADSLRDIACTASEESEKAWGILEEAVTEADFPVALQASLALAYTAASQSDWERAREIYREAASSETRETRIAAVEGLRTALEVTPDIAGDVVELLGAAARSGLTHIVDTHNDVQAIEEISSDQIRRERSSWKAVAGLSEAAASDQEAVKEVVDEGPISVVLETSFEDGAEKLF